MLTQRHIPAGNVNTGPNGEASGIRDLQMVSNQLNSLFGTALENGDIWIHPNELEAYPTLNIIQLPNGY